MVSSWLGRLFFWLLCLGLVTMAPYFFIGGLDWTANSLQRASWNLGHSVFFFGFTLACLMRTRLSGWYAWGILSALVLVLGLAVEIVQSRVGRHFDWGDVGLNLLGCWLALAIWPAAKLQPRKAHWVMLFLVIVLSGYQAAGIAQLALEERRVQQQVPLVFDQRRLDWLAFWQGTIEWEPEIEGRYAQPLRIDMNHRRMFSGVSLNRLPRDWRGYEALRFRLYNPEPDTWFMTLRVNDREHDLTELAFTDRFNVRLVLEPGWNEFRFDLLDIENAPLERRMDLQRIQRLGLFATQLEEPRWVALDDIRLE